MFLESEQMAGKTVKAQFFLMMLKKLLLLKKKCTSSTLARGSYCLVLLHSWSIWISTLEDRKYFENISYYINLGLKEKQNQVATKAKPWRLLTSWTLTTKTTVWWSRAFHSESRMMRSLSFSAAVELSLLTKSTLTKSMAENLVQLSWSLKILMQFKRLNLV